MLLLKNKKEALDLQGYTAIVPAICVGNAAQLALDLLISSKKLQRIGIWIHSAFIPIYGPSAYQHLPSSEKSAACEIYESVEDKLLVIQFRAPLISKHSKKFHNDLADLLKTAHRVIILSGSFGFEKRIIESSPYEYKVTDSFREQYAAELKTVKWNEFKGEMIFGGGNCLNMFKAFESLKVPTMLLFRYLLEGDNSTDASLIVRELNELCGDFLQISTQNKDGFKLTVPISWRLLFGNDVPELIF